MLKKKQTPLCGSPSSVEPRRPPRPPYPRDGPGLCRDHEEGNKTQSLSCCVISKLREKSGFSVPKNLTFCLLTFPTLPYGTPVPYGQIVKLRIIFWFQIMDHSNFIREFLHYFSSLLVNCGHRGLSYRKCSVGLLWIASLTRSRGGQHHAEEVDRYHVYCVVCKELLVPYFNHFSWWKKVLVNITKNSETFKLQLET
jgi:hypothetical protein